MKGRIDLISSYAVILMVLVITGSCKVFGQNARDKEGFMQLFDGKTLKGWEGDPTYWRMENGILTGEITPSTLLKTNSFIIWQGGKPADFELKVDCRITANGNSGINYRSDIFPGVPYALKGYQADIDGKNRYTGQNYEERSRTTLAYRGQKTTVNGQDTPGDLKANLKNNAWTKTEVTSSLGEAAYLQGKIKSEDWNEIHLVIKGNRLQHFVNGVLMSDVTDNDLVNRRMAGLLGVQVHVGPPMKVEYRNMRIKMLK